MDAQQEFDDKYVSSTELCRELDVTRATIMNARKRGALPAPVRIDRPDGTPLVMIWLRNEIAPFIERWRPELEARRGRAST